MRGFAVAAIVVLALAGCTSSGSTPRSTGTPSVTSGPPASPSPSPAVTPLRIRNRILDMSWVGARDGYALVAHRCGSGRPCAMVFRTTNGARTWRRVSAPASAPRACDFAVSCLARVWFADRRIGYLLGPHLYVTRDGGRSWSVDAAVNVDAVAGSAGRVYRVTYDHGGCPGPCDSQLQVAVPGSDSWSPTAAVPAFGNFGSDVIATGDNLYLVSYGHIAGGVESHALIEASHDGGASWRRIPDPCGRRHGNEEDAIDVAAQADAVAVLCVGKIGGPTLTTVSTDGGATFGPRRRVDLAFPSRIAVSPRGVVAVSGTGGHRSGFPFRVLVSSDGGNTWPRRLDDPVSHQGNVPAGDLEFHAGLLSWVSAGNVVRTSPDDGRTWTAHPAP